MPIKSIDHFNSAIKRSENLLQLFDLLANDRSRNVRKDKAQKIKSVMHWPKKEKIVMIESKKMKSVLLMKDTTQIDYKNFERSYIDEILRAALVSAVSALDRYVHDRVVENCIKMLNKKEDNIPGSLKRLKLSLIVTKNVLLKIKMNPSSSSKNKNVRPGFILKKAIQDELHLRPFQSVEEISNALSYVGIKEVWPSISKQFNPPLKQETIKTTLKKIADRRNQIVHEADLERKTRGKKISLRKIKRKNIEQNIIFIKSLVIAMEKVH